MTTLKMQIEKKRQNYTSIRSAFKSESGAIDLASIMVGIIVIGLIGGVIAATVFAVIPWTQDNAAKHQLESIHTAENAFYGLSADPAANLTGGKVNSFSDSASLNTAKLLTQAATYCVVPTTDGQNYTGFVKSASGKIFYAQNSSKTPKTLTSGTLPCTAAGIYDPANPPVGVDVGAGSGTTPVTPPVTAPTTEFVKEWTFDSQATGQAPSGWTKYNVSSQGMWTYSGDSHSPSISVSVGTTNANLSTSAIQNAFVFEAGATYRISAWVNPSQSVEKFNISANAINSSTGTAVTEGVWQKVSYDVKPTNGTFYLTGLRGNTSSLMSYLIDDVVIEKVL